MNRPWLKHVPEGNPETIDIPEISLSELLGQSVQEYPDHTAMTFFEESYTYSELAVRIEKAAAVFYGAGIRKGDRVAIMLPNCPQYPICFYGALACGATVVQLNPMFQPDELLHIVNDSETKAVVILDRLLPVFESVKERTSVETIFAVGLSEDFSAKEHPDPAPPVTIDPHEDVAVLQYTGGTTGLPKGAMLTHMNIVANTLQSAATAEIMTKKGEERVLCITPLFHVYGMTSGMCLTFLIGGNLILLPKFEIEQVVSVIEQTKPTVFPGVPTMFIALLNRYKAEKFDLSFLTSCTSGSAPLPLEVLHSFNDISGTTVAEGYGLSEASPVTHRNPVEGLQKDGSIGIPLPNTDAKVVDAATGEKELPANEIGELVIRGPQVMKGYWNKPEETENTLRDGWLFTGDLARMDEDGFFFIVGRKKEMILASGYNVYPIEVENVIYSHPAILEAAVFGVPDEYRGETVRAVAVLKENHQLTEKELEEYCRSRLSAYKVPTDISFVDELPKTAVGKILKRKLKEQFINQ